MYWSIIVNLIFLLVIALYSLEYWRLRWEHGLAQARLEFQEDLIDTYKDDLEFLYRRIEALKAGRDA